MTHTIINTDTGEPLEHNDVCADCGQVGHAWVIDSKPYCAKCLEKTKDPGDEPGPCRRSCMREDCWCPIGWPKGRWGRKERMEFKK